MKSCSINFKIFSDKSSFTSMKIISFNTRRDYNDATNVLILFFKFVKVQDQHALKLQHFNTGSEPTNTNVLVLTN